MKLQDFFAKVLCIAVNRPIFDSMHIDLNTFTFGVNNTARIETREDCVAVEIQTPVYFGGGSTTVFVEFSEVV